MELSANFICYYLYLSNQSTIRFFFNIIGLNYSILNAEGYYNSSADSWGRCRDPMFEGLAIAQYVRWFHNSMRDAWTTLDDIIILNQRKYIRKNYFLWNSYELKKWDCNFLLEMNNIIEMIKLVVRVRRVILVEL